MYSVEDVSFSSSGDQIAGRLFIPERPAAQAAAFIAIGPVSFVKEQSPVQYATRLARAGHVALIFDPRGFGASEGEPRLYDSPERKTQDVQAAADFLLGRPEVEATRLTGLGICMGCNWMAQAVADDPRFRRAVLVAGAYSIRTRRIEQAGGEEAFAEQLAGARTAVERYEQDGTLDHHTMVAETMEQSYFSWAVPYHWYGMWTDPGPLATYKGTWANRLATISDHDHYAFDVAQAFARLTVPTLVINSTKSATPLPVVRDLVELLPGPDARLIDTGDQIQVQFYDDPITIDLAVDAIIN